ncbi:class I SAM-dependent methyltransferase [Terricaulis sp.]|uniref:class I SAM-dependent methyltransferase n=1 Tax=Terricaulis sp. TaxID=2768686 RepID=UPI00378454A1
MSTTAAAQFVGDIPTHYDAKLGPILFADYAADLARRAAALKPAAVLEVACGTGISTVALANTLPSNTSITATDLNPPMLEIARSKLHGAANIEFAQADAMKLPFADASFDLIVIQFGVMFFPDKPAAFTDAKRVLRPGGTLLFNAWGKMAANPFSEVAHANGQKFLPANPPKFYLTPFGYADEKIARADLAKGGFGEVHSEVVRFNKDVSDFQRFAEGAIYGNPMLGDLIAGGVDPAAVVASITADLRARFGHEPAKMPLEATVYQARAR